MKNKILLSLFCLFFLACSTLKKKDENAYFSFREENIPIQIPVFELQDFMEIPFDTLAKYDFKEVNDSIVIISGFQIRSKKVIINRINLNTKTCKRKTFTFDAADGQEYIADYKYINEDSIILQFTSDYEDNSHDEILYLVNDRGELQKRFSLAEAPVYTKGNPAYGEGNDLAAEITPIRYGPIGAVGDRIFLRLESKSDCLGDPAFADVPHAGYLQGKDDHFTVIPLKMPGVDFGKTYFTRVFKRYFICPFPPEMIYAYRHSPTLLRYNYKTGEQRTARLQSRIYDTIYPQSNPEDVPRNFDFQLPFPQYFTLVYDKYRKLFYRFLLSPAEYGNKLSMIVGDKDMNYMAEGFSVKGWNLFPTQKYILSFVAGTKKHNTSRKVIELGFYKLKFRKGSNQELIDVIKSCKKIGENIRKPLTHYVSKFGKLKGKTYTAAFLHYEICPNIREFILELFRRNKKIYAQNKVYLFLVTSRPQKLMSDLRTFNLLPENNPNIVIDSSFTYLRYNQGKSHDLPRLMTVENKKITADTILIPGENPDQYPIDFQNFIVDFIDKQR